MLGTILSNIAFFFTLVWGSWGRWQCITVQSGDCLMVRYRECSTRNNDDCPDKNYSFQPCTKLTCPGKLSPKTYLVFCLY